METLKCFEFNARPGGVIGVRHYDEPIYTLSESQRDVISPLYCDIRERFPEAYSDLCIRYKDSIQNTWHFEFKVVCGFIKCNWSTFDNSWDIDENGDWHFELTICPLSGECKSEGRICNPKEKIPLSDSELRVLILVARGRQVQSIAEELFLSPKTVEAHVYNMNKKLHTNSNSQLTSYAYRKHII